MNFRQRHPAVHLREFGARIVAEGDLATDNVADFEVDLLRLVESGMPEVVIDLAGLDMEDGLAVVVAVNVLRELRERVDRLVLAHAPQILAHNLYRVGLLEGDHPIVLVDMREDEAYG